MIARFRILLPYTFSIPTSLELPAFEFDRGAYRVRINPPCQAILNPQDIAITSPVPAFEIFNGLVPATPQLATDAIQMNGSPTIQANLLQIDFLKDEFDRHTSDIELEDQIDPPLPFVFEVANEFLATIRAITRAGPIRPITSDSLWRLRYLTNEGQELEYKEGYRRGQSRVAFSWKIVGISAGLWGKVSRLMPGYTPPTWATLLMDAEDLLPDVGPSIVLAAAALETLIATSLNLFASQTTMPAGLWEWINDRGDYRKEPSVEEQLDKLLLFLGKRSLKSENNLWVAFKNLKEARNNFVHEGKAYVGKQEVTQTMAYSLVANAKQIAAWVEGLLPLEQRLSTHEESFAFQVMKPLEMPDEAKSNA